MSYETVYSTFSIGPLALVAAFLLDLLLGEPKRLPHPVVLIGKVVHMFDKLLNRSSFSPFSRKMAGIIVAVIIPVTTFFFIAFIVDWAYRFGNFPGIIVATTLAYSTLSTRGLHNAANCVTAPLSEGNLVGAREALSHIVGRDTVNLDESEIVRATVETVAENTSDGVIAPLFYMIIGGVPLSMAYKAINTLDSMIGYKNDKYTDFGRASARLDDLVNLIPARLTAFLMVASSFLLKMDWKGALRIIASDGRNHPSPNAGYPEAAAAGAIKIKLGGTNSYSDKIENRPQIGNGTKVLRREDIGTVVKLMYLSTLLMIAGSIALKGLLR